MRKIVVRYKFGEGVVPFKLEPKTKGSSGIDLCSANKDKTTISPGKSELISTGLYLELPSGYEAQIRSRSGLAGKNNVFVLNSPGTVDSDYRNEIKVILYNASDIDFDVSEGDRIAQMVIQEVPEIRFFEVEELSDSDRGLNGFGSTGINDKVHMGRNKEVKMYIDSMTSV